MVGFPGRPDGQRTYTTPSTVRVSKPSLIAEPSGPSMYMVICESPVPKSTTPSAVIFEELAPDMPTSTSMRAVFAAAVVTIEVSTILRLTGTVVFVTEFDEPPPLPHAVSTTADARTIAIRE